MQILAKNCSEETKEKLRKLSTGRKWKLKSKKKMSKTLTGRTLPKEWRENIGNAQRGKMRGPSSESARINISKSLMHHEVLPLTREKIRIGRVKNMIASGQYPSYNKKACKMFEAINTTMDWTGHHALNGGEKIINNCWVDYYEPHKKLIIEFYERHHYRKNKLREKDKEREIRIAKNTDNIFMSIKYDGEIRCQGELIMRVNDPINKLCEDQEYIDYLKKVIS